jgi:putative ABC transport system permease protein
MLDDSFDKLYLSEKRLGKLFISLTILSFLIASLGLFGLASFSTKQRIKEIGIRKVLGASVMQIVIMLSKDLIKWVIVASLIAWPVAYVLVNLWLKNFQYKIELSIWTFVISTFIGLLVAIITANYQAIKAALSNPADSLKYE